MARNGVPLLFAELAGQKSASFYFEFVFILVVLIVYTPSGLIGRAL